MAYDPLAMDDPSHPLHNFAADFAQMRQRRQMHDQRQAMMAQQLAQPGAAPTMGDAWHTYGALPGAAASPGGGSAMGGAMSGLAGLAQALKGPGEQGTYSSKIGGVGQAENTGGWLQNLFTANGGMKGPDPGPGPALPAGKVVEGNAASGMKS